jgi:mannose-6-phosphate isomerase-like protein (cupin superfamily)
MNLKKNSKMPEWMGNFPVSAKNKKPFLVKKGQKKSLIYGRGNNLDITPVYISTDKIGFFGEYSIPPGGHFDPPDIHAGDECYYCLEGTAHIFNPESGQVVELNKGDALLIPKGTWHVGFNFSSKNFRLLAVIVPLVWSEDDMGLEVDFKGRQLFYKDKEK